VPLANKPRSLVAGELRPSQLITTFGPGAVVDQRTASTITASLDHWDVGDDQRIDEPRLRAMLRVQNLFRPPVKSDRGVRGVPAFVFPRYLVCPRCDRLASYDRFFFDGRRFRCHNKEGHKNVTVPKAGPVVYPARFVVACPAGHLDDFPWTEYVHRSSTVSCDPLELTFYEGSGSGAVSDLFVRCRACEKFRSMADAFDESAPQVLGPCSGERPWMGTSDAEPGCQESVRTVLRGASNLYFSVVQSALSIPEWDDPVHAAIAYYDGLESVDTKEEFENGMKFLVRLSAFSADKVWEALQARRGVDSDPPTPADLRFEEYKALCAPSDPVAQADRQFQTEHMGVPEAHAALVERLVVVRRLREVRALAGFTRIDSPPDILIEGDEHEQEVTRQALARDDPGWRPAVELLGEGVFFTLKEQEVSTWEQAAAVKGRVTEMERAHQEWRRVRELPDALYPGPRFVLLHSIAHMLINALALDCGYSATAIRERIYSSTQPDAPMAGVLLYTATPDSDGSLGGLADQGETSRFDHILTTALRRATYCSSDPLCGHAPPGSMGHLNGAACHACLLVAETSCERSNRYLDRAHVVETVAHLDTEFFRE
jgi:hypothetical protein